MQPLSNVSEREEWESSTREYEPFQSAKREPPNPDMEYLYFPFHY
jgi:hypothetical protein